MLYKGIDHTHETNLKLVGCQTRFLDLIIVFLMLEKLGVGMRLLGESVLEVGALVRVVPVFHLCKRQKVLGTVTLSIKWFGSIHFE